ncbi:hypothetical protein EYR36_005083 [Pleurotus pulmonarius]|nr:hypothetical protein EYR36_005083 [Pleurotus pulmonarius]
MYPATPSPAAAESTASGPVANWLATSWYDSPEGWDSGNTNGSTGDDEWDNHSDIDEGESQGGPTVVGAIATDDEEVWDNHLDVDDEESQDGPIVVGAMAWHGVANFVL